MGLSQRSLLVVATTSGLVLAALAVVFAATSGGGAAAVADSPAWADALSLLGGPLVLPLVTLAIAVGLGLAGHRTEARFLCIVVAGAGVLVYVLKGVLQVLGADHDGGRLSDYPSGHEAVTAALVLALLAIVWPYPAWRPARAVLISVAVVVAAAMGWSRVAAGAHSLLDVAGGAVLAVGWVAICLLVWPPGRAAG